MRRRLRAPILCTIPVLLAVTIGADALRGVPVAAQPSATYRLVEARGSNAGLEWCCTVSASTSGATIQSTWGTHVLSWNAPSTLTSTPQEVTLNGTVSAKAGTSLALELDVHGKGVAVSGYSTGSNRLLSLFSPARESGSATFKVAVGPAPAAGGEVSFGFSTFQGSVSLIYRADAAAATTTAPPRCTPRASTGSGSIGSGSAGSSDGGISVVRGGDVEVVFRSAGGFGRFAVPTQSPQNQGCVITVSMRIISPTGSGSSIVVDVNTPVVFRIETTGVEAPFRILFEVRSLARNGVFGPVRSCDGPVCEFTQSSPVLSTVEYRARVVDGAEPVVESAPIQVRWKPTPKTVTFDYTIPSNFGKDINKDGLIDYVTTAQELRRRKYIAMMTVAKCPTPASGRLYEWRYTAASGESGRLDSASNGKCVWRVEFPKEGLFTVDVAVEGPNGQMYEGRSEVNVQDWLIVGIGDSLASGEGNPAFGRGPSAKWQSRRCDRSSNSYQALAAKALEDNDPKTSVTFVHLACSGAAIVDHANPPVKDGGLLNPYEGIIPASPPLPAQLEQAKAIVEEREVDAFLVSIGVNEFEFGNLLAFCADRGRDCNDGLIADADYDDRTGRRHESLPDFLNERFRLLPLLYDRLDLAMTSTFGNSASKRIFITEYPDTVHEGAGNLCEAIDLDPPVGYLDKSWLGKLNANEVSFLFTSLLQPLNTAIGATQGRLGWNVVPLAGADFVHHGYCATGSWVVSRAQSFLGQGDQNGSMHPNIVGHREIGRLVGDALRPQLYPGGKPRPPR